MENDIRIKTTSGDFVNVDWILQGNNINYINVIYIGANPNKETLVKLQEKIEKNEMDCPWNEGELADCKNEILIYDWRDDIWYEAIYALNQLHEEIERIKDIIKE